MDRRVKLPAGLEVGLLSCEPKQPNYIEGAVKLGGDLPVSADH